MKIDTNTPGEDGMALWQAGDFLTWIKGDLDLPEIVLQATLPVHYPDLDGPDSLMEEKDPWFILGNYGLTLFPHVSGSYQFMYGARGFARLNHDASESVTGRRCQSLLTIDGVTHDLLASPSSEQRFGCGFATWTYDFGGLRVIRRLDTLPSRDSRDAVPAFRVSLHLENHGTSSPVVTWSEGIGIHYHLANWNNPPLGRQLADYPVTGESNDRAAHATFHPRARVPLVFGNSRRVYAQADGYPPEVHLEVVEGNSRARTRKIDETSLWLLAEGQRELAPGDSTSTALLIGWSDPRFTWAETRTRFELPVASLRQQWRDRLPAFAEATPDLRSELQWHAHVLHAMATWDDRFECTFIPQGTLYEFGVGVSACTRDQAMHALPACVYDPDLARSVLSYLCRITDFNGRVQSSVEGLGIYPVGMEVKSDNELFCLCLAAEYLEATSDPACLQEMEPFFPVSESSPQGTLLQRMGMWIRFVRDGIYQGRTGLVRLMLSDFSDGLYNAFPGLPYNLDTHHMVFTGESHVNTTLALRVLRRIAHWLGEHSADLGDQRELALSIVEMADALERQIREAFTKDLEGRPWIPRARVGKFVLGEEDAFSLPHSFFLGNPGFPLEQRERIWQNIKPLLWDGEPLGVLLRSGKDVSRSGMAWFAWLGLLSTELCELAPEDAEEGLERLRLKRRAQIYPRQWVGLWSHSDGTFSHRNTPAGAIPGTFRVTYVQRFPHFCAHVHAWPIMVWQRLQSRRANSP